MDSASEFADRGKVWDLIKDRHVALLVTVGKDGMLDSRPMGCVQKDFDGTLWFMTFRNSPKTLDIDADRRVLVSYGDPSNYEFISMSGSARVVDDRAKVRELWTEGLTVWFPDGPESDGIALIAIDVETVKAWTEPASMLSYGISYLRAKLTGERPQPGDVARITKLEL